MATGLAGAPGVALAAAEAEVGEHRRARAGDEEWVGGGGLLTGQRSHAAAAGASRGRHQRHQLSVL